ncbi:unnamed protein product [Parnassius apollo]|uniref:(apollo) hypothetical protein n=1 Tax=Parnassius apollo TaxID=110799 RepID=A0A8S3YCJ8_PARAO|nr:unnamed protein product [Parnassius apollo]
MADIHVLGLPKNVKKPRLVNLLRTVVFGKKLKCKFWIREAYPLPNSQFQQVVVNISKRNDAYKAVDLINDFVYFNGTEDFQLSAVIVDDHVPQEHYDEPMPEVLYAEKKHISREKEIRQSNKRKRSPLRNKERSRSPHYRNESTKLDMEIELVRKQRLLVEEERKLLLEKKKLELLKEFGPGTVKKLEKYAAAIEKHSLEDDEPPKPQITVTKKSESRRATTGLPLFVLPCRIIIKQMKTVLTNHTNENNKFELLKALRMTIRKRIAELLQTKTFMQTGEIIQLYRETYPLDTDEKLLQQLEAEIKVNANVAEDNKSATDIKENDNPQEKTEAKFSPGESNIPNIENKDTKTEIKNDLSEKNGEGNCEEKTVKKEIKEDLNVNDGLANLDGDSKEKENAKFNKTMEDMYAELDDWLEEENSTDKKTTTDSQLVDNNTSAQNNKDVPDLKQTQTIEDQQSSEVTEDKKE